MNQMEQWWCFKDKELMVEGDALVHYLEVSSVIKAIKCPKCGTAYLLEETVVERVNKAEEMIENK